MWNIRSGCHSFFQQLWIMTREPPRPKKEIDGKQRDEEPGCGPIDASSDPKERATYGSQADETLHSKLHQQP